MTVQGIQPRSVAAQQVVLGTATAILAIALVAWVSPFDSYLGEMSNTDRSDLYQLSGQIGATLLGFGIAAITILISIPDSTRFSLFSKSKWYGLVLALFLGATTWALLWTGASLAGVVMDQTTNPSNALVVVFVVLAVESLLHIAGCLLALLMIIELVVVDRRPSIGTDAPPSGDGQRTSSPDSGPTSPTLPEGFD